MDLTHVGARLLGITSVEPTRVFMPFLIEKMTKKQSDLDPESRFGSASALKNSSTVDLSPTLPSPMAYSNSWVEISFVPAL